MSKLKIGSILLFLFFGLNYGFSQSYKFKTTGLSVSVKEGKSKFGDWSELKPVSILVNLDTNKNRIVIYSEVIQLFEIIESLPAEESATDLVYPFVCKDNNGEDCTLSFITRKKQDNRKQLYVKYEDRVFAYNIVNFE
ncbi:hypothetical protein DOS84_06580 [Flavobacterium aquariorum]|uniref:Uncharacterized protein n=1 Tax=Flavobacterium aquariorum TaxID=2217670 RepID=A0A2W7TXZ8_9FLAO|nr:hypothetical protein [Flavobacterium aquariorum]PZX94286.1 hypothetical protein DOS84_06580 [Flavobacterium aquariorum]